MDFSLQMQSPSWSQMPLVCPSVTQEAEQAHWPRVHLNPAMEVVVRVARITRRLVLGDMLDVNTSTGYW